MEKPMVIYYSHSGVTREVALKIRKITDADIYEIQAIEPYPADVYETIDIFKDEMRDKSIRPIRTPEIDLTQYETVFVGTPNWGSTVATPLLDFFNQVDLSNKKVLPFVTHEGGGVGNCAKDIIALSMAGNMEALVLSSGRVRDVSEASIKNWIKGALNE